MYIWIPGVHFAIYSLVLWVLIGALAGFLASSLVRGKSYGCLGNTVVGLIGAIIGGYLASFLNITGDFQFWGTLGISFIGACIFVFILQALTGNKKRF